MTAQIAFVYVLLALTIGAFIIDRWRMDMVALMVVIVLALSGIITPGEAVAGFGNTIVVMIAALFVVGGWGFFVPALQAISVSFY